MSLVCLPIYFQMDCPEDVAAYIHRVGRTARYLSGGRSVLFLMPSEMKMLNKLEEKKIPIRFIKVLFLIQLIRNILYCIK